MQHPRRHRCQMVQILQSGSSKTRLLSNNYFDKHTFLAVLRGMQSTTLWTILNTHIKVLIQKRRPTVEPGDKLYCVYPLDVRFLQIATSQINCSGAYVKVSTFSS